MLSNVYTKDEILKELSSKGYFIDTYTLGTFFEQWHVEAIYEDEQGKEFYDKNTLDLIMSNLFDTPKEEKEENQTMPVLDSDNEPSNEQNQQEPQQDSQEFQEHQEEFQQENSQEIIQEQEPVEEPVQDSAQEDIQEPVEEQEQQPESIIEETIQEHQENTELNNEQEYQPQEQGYIEQETQENFMPQEQEDIDDMSLISDSFEAQEKFREYVLSQMAKTNPELAPRNEFKLDISERTLNMVARALAKKVAKYVSSMFGAEAKSMAKFDELKEKNQFLEQKIQALEEQNKKLRMLLTESNRNLNSYKPGLFGLYKKVPPKR